MTQFPGRNQIKSRGSTQCLDDEPFTGLFLMWVDNHPETTLSRLCRCSGVSRGLQFDCFVGVYDIVCRVRVRVRGYRGGHSFRCFGILGAAKYAQGAQNLSLFTCNGPRPLEQIQSPCGTGVLIYTMNSRQSPKHLQDSPARDGCQVIKAAGKFSWHMSSKRQLGLARSDNACNKL